jgi:hypothetical protein
VGVLAFVHNSVQMWYYWLPVDSNRQKYVPGKFRCFPQWSSELGACFLLFCRGVFLYYACVPHWLPYRGELLSYLHSRTAQEERTR